MNSGDCFYIFACVGDFNVIEDVCRVVKDRGNNICEVMSLMPATYGKLEFRWTTYLTGRGLLMQAKANSLFRYGAHLARAGELDTER